MWRTEDQTEALVPPVIWTGFTVFEQSQAEVIVEQETHDKAVRDAKALPRPSPNEPTAQQTTCSLQLGRMFNNGQS